MPLLYVEKTVEFSYPEDPKHIYRIRTGFELSAGEKVCIIGPSGSGKSTLLTMLAGLRRFDRGEIVYRMGGKEQRLTGADWNAGPQLWGQIGFSFQRPELINALRVADNLRLSQGDRADAVGRELFPVRADGEVLQDEWTDIRKRRTTQLSGGQKLRVGLGRAFGEGQRLVIIDEPTGALDLDNRNMVAAFVNENARNIGLLVVAHDSEFIDLLNVDRKYDIAQLGEGPHSAGRVARELSLMVPAVA